MNTKSLIRCHIYKIMEKHINLNEIKMRLGSIHLLLIYKYYNNFMYKCWIWLIITEKLINSLIDCMWKRNKRNNWHWGIPLNRTAYVLYCICADGPWQYSTELRAIYGQWGNILSQPVMDFDHSGRKSRGKFKKYASWLFLNISKDQFKQIK